MILERRLKGSNAVRHARTPSPRSNAVAPLDPFGPSGARLPQSSRRGVRAGRRRSSGATAFEQGDGVRAGRRRSSRATAFEHAKRRSSIIYGVPACFLKGGFAAFFSNPPGSAFEFHVTAFEYFFRRSSISFGVRVSFTAFEFHLRRSSFICGVRVSFTAFEFHLRRSGFVTNVKSKAGTPQMKLERCK